MARLRFETDLSTSLKAGADLNAVYKKLGDTVKGSVREMNALEKAAKRITDQNLTPQERYNQKLETMAKAVKAGKMEMADAERTAARLRQKLDDVGSSGGKTFGAKAIGDLKSYATGFIGVGAAVGIVSQALQKMSADSQVAADRVFNTVGAFGELQQVSTSPPDFQKLVGQARNLQTQGVFGPDQGGQAADFVFGLRNAGYSDSEVAYITKLGQSKQVRPDNLKTVAEGLKKTQDVFGKGEAGSIEQIANKVLIAAGAMQTDFALAAVGTTLFGTESNALGFSDEEALAAFVAIEKQSPGTEEAATRMRSLLNQINKDKLGKGTLLETVTALVERMRSGESAIGITGEMRAAAGLNILASAEGQAMFSQMLPQIQAGNTSDVIGDRRYIESDPQLRAATLRQRREGSLSMSLDSTKRNIFEALVAETKSRQSGFSYAASSAIYPIIEGLGGEEGAFRAALNRTGDSAISPELRSEILEYMKRTAESNERMERGLEAPRPSGRQEQ